MNAKLIIRKIFYQFLFIFFPVVCFSGYFEPWHKYDSIFDAAKVESFEGVKRLTEILVFYAIDKNLSEVVVSELINKGADVNVKNFKSGALLIKVIFNRNITLENTLISAGIDLEDSNNLNHTALLVAGDLNDLAIVKNLLNAGAKVNSKDRDGRSALIRYGADINAKIFAPIVICKEQKSDLMTMLGPGSTALIFARLGGWCAIKKVLIDAGANDYSDLSVSEIIKKDFKY